MRQLVMAVLLIGAAFAGGAVVNGPGLRWLRDNVLSQGEEDGDAVVAEGNESGIPSAPLPALGGDAPSEGPPKAPEKAAAKPDSEPPRAPRARVAAQSLETPPAAGPAAMLPVPEALGPVAALPPLEAPVDAEAPPPAHAPGQGGEPAAPKAAVAPLAAGAPPRAAEPWADAPDSGPAAAVPPKGYRKPAEADSAVAAATASADDWPALRRKMQALGVTRYALEGEPGGRVRFHCVIPLAGRRAVGQQFEGEGDNEFQAAQVALRRVALWQATEAR